MAERAGELLEGRFAGAGHRGRRGPEPLGSPPLIGLFETLRVYGGRPFRVAAHLERLARSARDLDLPVPRAFAAARIERRIRELAKSERLPDSAARILLDGGRSRVWVAPLVPRPAAWYARGARVEMAPFTRDPRAPLAGHKSTGALDGLVAHRQAAAEGAADVLLTSPDGALQEGGVSNVFLVRRGRLVTPSLDQGILSGITRAAVLELAREAGIACEERRVERDEIRRAQEAFLTSSLMEVLPVARVEGRPVGGGRPGPVTRALARAYRALVARECGA